MNDFKDLKNAAQQKTNDTIKEASKAYENVKNTAESVSNQVQDTVSDYYAEGKKKAEQACDIAMEQKDFLIETIKDNPLASILIAAGIGYLFAKLKK